MRRFVAAGEELFLRYYTSVSPVSLQGVMRIVPWGKRRARPEILSTDLLTSFTTDRTATESERVKVPYDAEIVGGGIQGDASGVKRGQMYVVAHVGKARSIFEPIADGYYHAGKALLGIGEFEAPRSGHGYHHWVQVSDDAPGNASVVYTLAKTNTFRRIWGFLLKYHASADVATRTLSMRHRDAGPDTDPTGWSLTENIWLHPQLTLTADQEGIMLAKPGFTANSDNGVLSFDDITTAPNPFPIDVEENGNEKLRIDIANGNVNDDFDTHLLIEEWIDP